MDEFSKGMLLGLLIGEGHFGGDGKQPQITLRMHSRHEDLFHYLVRLVPVSRLYGPYNHGGRSYFQWMVRGQALREHLLPLLETIQWGNIDSSVYERYRTMLKRYGMDSEGKIETSLGPSGVIIS
jgi:hypothetical protein